jgi:Protein of unknown function (DUF2971)
MPDSQKSETAVVYHYTDVDTMMKIVDSACLWATSIKYLNDVKEYEHFRDIVRKNIPRLIESQSFGSDERELLDEFCRPKSTGPDTGIVQAIPNVGPFVASCSSSNDSLPQWRSYCANGNGVAIGFRVDCLRLARAMDLEELHHGAFRFGAVEYLELADEHRVDAEIKKAVSSAMKDRQQARFFRRSRSTPERDMTRYYFSQAIDQFAPFIKHPSFSTENEYRLLFDTYLNGQDVIRFRASRTTLTPYVRLKVPEPPPSPQNDESTVSEVSKKLTRFKPFKHLDRRDSFVSRVIVGPTPNMDLSLSAIRSFFHSRGLKVAVERSEVPYRDW